MATPYTPLETATILFAVAPSSRASREAERLKYHLKDRHAARPLCGARRVEKILETSASAESRAEVCHICLEMESAIESKRKRLSPGKAGNQ
jgi:hypothetical protein